MAGRVVYDSDDDSDISPPPRSPAVMVPEHIQSRPATPPRAMVALMEPSPLPVVPVHLPDTLSFPHPGPEPVPVHAASHHTSSTDLSFFQNVYEEQQRAIGAQLGAQLSTGRDLWDVPSSPMQPPARPSSNTSDSKRKRETSSKENSSSSSGKEPPKRQKQQQDADPAMGSGLEISIPLEPMTPSMMHQYPQMLSSSMDQSYPGEVTHTLGRGLAAYNQQQQPPPTAEPTQSTVAFATPSIYASSGRRGLGSSNDPVVDEVHMVEEVVTVEPEPEPEPYTFTPPRKTRAPLLMSSPDIIAGPAPEPEPLPVPLPAPLPAPLPEPRQAETKVRDEIDDSGSELSFHSSPGRVPSPAMPASPEQPAKASPKKKPKKVIIIKRPAVIAASDDEDFDSDGEDDLAGGGNHQHVYAAPGSPLSDLDNVFSDSAPKKKAPKKEKKEKAPPKSKAKSKKSAAVAEAPSTKTNEVILIELPGQAPSIESLPPQSPSPPPQPVKRPRGRPKQVAKTEYKDSEESDGFKDEIDNVSEAEVAAKPVAKPAAKAAKATKATNTKGKKGRGKKVVDDGDGDELSTPATALGETSGNAVPASIPEAKTTPEAEEEKPAPVPIPAPVEEKEKPASPVVKPAVSGLSTGLGGLGGRVLYRVGLSKKTRIAPLLKIVRK